MNASPGKWRIGYRAPNGDCLDHLIDAIVWQRSATAVTEPGQWLAEFNSGDHNGQIPQLLRSIACRLGLLPIHFAPDYEDVLRGSEPLCIVADTNSLYHGSLYQALRLRVGQPTTVVVPDQVFMELQRRRGRAAKGGSTSNMIERVVQSARLALPLVGTRVLDRIRTELRFVVHQARPPEAMVRYFGSDAGDRPEGEGGSVDSAGPSFQRDRLILEVVRHAPSLLPPGVPVWLATGDADLAAQAACEGFKVGFSWIPNDPKRFVATSPHIDARTGKAHFVEWQTVLEELVWNLGGISLQRHGDARQWEHRLPDARDRILGEHGIPWSSRYSREVTPNAPRGREDAAPPSGGSVPRLRSAPKKAPAAQSLVKFLVEIARGEGVPVDTVFEPVRPYLSALDWATATGGKYSATSRGRELADSWSSLTRDSVKAHSSWLRSASTDLLALQPFQAMRETLAGRRGVDVAELAHVLSLSESQVHSQARLMAAFGIIVRVSPLQWGAEERSADDCKRLVLTALHDLRAETNTVAGAVRADALFRKLLDTTALSLPDFRLALWLLHTEGLIRGSGSAPPTDRSDTIVIDLLLPDSGHEPVVEAVNLGAGDFLIPGESSQAIHLVEGA